MHITYFTIELVITSNVYLLMYARINADLLDTITFEALVHTTQICLCSKFYMPFMINPFAYKSDSIASIVLYCMFIDGAWVLHQIIRDTAKYIRSK